jgi:chromosome segregation ATPase
MQPKNPLEDTLERIEKQLQHMEEKIDALGTARKKSMEWIGVLSEQIQSLDVFREEVRASYEALASKLDGIEEWMRILKHATSDVSRRVEELEQKPHKKVG